MTLFVAICFAVVHGSSKDRVRDPTGSVRHLFIALLFLKDASERGCAGTERVFKQGSFGVWLLFQQVGVVVAMAAHSRHTAQDSVVVLQIGSFPTAADEALEEASQRVEPSAPSLDLVDWNIDVPPVSQGVRDGLIDALICLVALIVFECVFSAGDDENGGERQDDEDGRGRSAKDGKHLENDEEQEVQVGHASELLKEILWQERVPCVFGGSNLVGHERAGWLAILVEFVRR